MKICNKRQLFALLLLVAAVIAATPVSGHSYDMGRSGEYQTISVGTYHTLAIKADGSLWAWGLDIHGHGGGDATKSVYNLVKVMDNVATAAAGGFHNVAVKTDGSLWAWGGNDYGQIGDGTETICNYTVDDWGETEKLEDNDRDTPVKIMDDVAAVSAGYEYSAAIKNDDSLWTWGRNGAGQLGDGSKITRLSPVKIMDDVVSVSAGSNFILAVKTDGSLWAWGANGDGQLGDGTTMERQTPVKIMDGVSAVSAGFRHSMAIKTDGSLWTWGCNAYGTLGDGTSTFWNELLQMEENNDRHTPVKIMDAVVAVSAGNGHSMAIKADGSLWAWGSNEIGQISNNKLPEKQLSPVKIMDGTVSVSAGGYHSVAIKTDGSLWGWGGWYQWEQPYNVTDELEFVPMQKIMDGMMLPGSKPSSWAEKDVETAIDAGIVPENLRLRYAQTITRAEFCGLAVALYEIVTGVEISERRAFADIDDMNVEKAAGIGVVNGVGNNSFAPNNALTREQAATMLARLADAAVKPLGKSAATFSDNDKISSWSIDAAGQVQAAGIMGGVGNNTFAPKSPYTREQSIVTMLRLYDFMK